MDLSPGTGVVEVLAGRFAGVVRDDPRLEQLWTGGRWLEGPVWFPAHRSLVFSDIPNDRLLRYDETTGDVGVFRAGDGRFTNGNTIDRQGRLVSCEHGTRQVTRTEHDGTVTVIADRHHRRRLNSPNDVVVRSDGSVWFTDPPYGIESDEQGFVATSEIGENNVYRVDPCDGTVTMVADRPGRPNGLCFSPDERLLYVSDSEGPKRGGERTIRRYEVTGAGTLEGGEVIAEPTVGAFDGFRVDTAGRIWTSAGDGVHCLDPDGTLLGKILVPETVANVTFGGGHLDRLYICATTSLYAVDLGVTGAPLV